MIDNVSRTGYLTMRQAAAWLGIGDDRAAALRLRRLLEAIERRDGRPVMQRCGTGKGTRLKVTRAGLRAHLAEHWLTEERVVSVAREHVAKLEERMAALQSEVDRGRIERRVLGKKVAELQRLLYLSSGNCST